MERPARWMSAEAIADGRAFIAAWDTWRGLVAVEQKFRRSVWLFILVLPYYLFISRKADRAYTEVREAQEKWNSHYVKHLRTFRKPEVVQ